ncbi:MAG: ABC transporter substrate-binding protein [Bacteroidales bacterium]|nr:ABC transporter substrate-binding protein [Bacteroidales bacterium]
MRKYILFILAALLFFSCDTSNDEIVIGAILPLTGDAASYGISAKEGYELAIQEVNSNYPDRTILLKFEDSKALPKEAVNAYLKLKSTFAPSIFFGLLSSPEVLSVAPMAEKDKTIIFSSGASSPLISLSGDYIFRDVPSDLLEAGLMAETAINELGINKIAIIYINSDYGIGVLNKFKERFEELGGELVAEESYNSNQTDFKTYLLKIKNSQPDGIYFIGYKELGRIVKQAKELNVEAQYLSNALFEDPEILEIAGNAAENLIFTTFYFDSESTDPRTSEFVKNYKNKYGKSPDGFAVAAYDAIHVVFKALGNKEVNSETIKSSLYQLNEFNGLLGKFKFDKNGDVILPVKLKIVKNNEFINY